MIVRSLIDKLQIFQKNPKNIKHYLGKFFMIINHAEKQTLS